MGKLSWHVDSPPPFAFVTADQQVKPFGRTLGPRHAHTQSTLRADAIPGSRPKQHCFATSPRLTNPLEPHYTLPHHNHPQPAAPVLKFIKNPLDNSDIPGAQASPRIGAQQYKQNFRLDCSDVDGAAPGWQPEWKRAAHARHASHRPATAPTHKHQDKAVRPSNYVRDIERSSPWHPSTADMHQSKVAAADAAASRRTAAQQLLQQKVGGADVAAVASLWRQFRQLDREASGKVTTSEFAKVLQSSNSGLTNAEVLRVANGMADCHGLMDYRRVTQMLQSQGPQMPRPQSAVCADVGTRKPPLARPCSMAGTPRSSGHVGQGAKLAQHADRQAQSSLPAPVSSAAVDAADDHKHSCSSSSSVMTRAKSTKAELQLLPQQLSAPPSSAANTDQQEGRADTHSCPSVSDSSGHVAAALRDPGAVPASAVRSHGPPQQKVPYFFSKGQVNIEQPYRWMPSRDNTYAVDAASKGHFVRPWTAGQVTTRPTQGEHSSGCGVVHAPSDAVRPESVFFDDSRPYQSPVPAAASLDFSRIDSPTVRRQNRSLLEDMMTIRLL